MFSGVSKHSIEALLSPSKLVATRPLFGYIRQHWIAHVKHAKECDDTYKILLTLFEKRYDLLKCLDGREYDDFTADRVEGLGRLLRFAVVVGSS